MAKGKSQSKEAQSLEQLTKRFRDLEERKIRNQAVLGETEKQLEDLLHEAEQMFGTREIDELQLKLTQMENENEKKRADYQKQLNQIEQSLESISDELGDFDDGADTVSRKSPK